MEYDRIYIFLDIYLKAMAIHAGHTKGFLL